MNATAPNSANPSPSPTDAINDSLAALSGALDHVGDRMFDGGFFDTVGKELHRLHAAIRQHHAIGAFGAGRDALAIPPELASDFARLRDEHSTILGLLDRMIRGVDSMVDRPIEDKEVFVLRGREVVAFVRRHEAEEDRLFYLAMWRDTGGES